MFSVLILWSRTLKLHWSAPAPAVRGPWANTDSWGKQGGFSQPGHLWLCLNSGAREGWGGLAAAQTEFKCHCQLQRAWLESAMKKGSKAVQEHSAVAHKKGFYCSNPFFCTEWVLAAGPDNGSPSPCLGWGNWVCRGTHLQLQTGRYPALPRTCCLALFARVSFLPPLGDGN